LDSGPKIRIYYVLKELCKRHAVTLLSFVRSTRELKHVPHLLGFCEEVRTVPIKRSRVKDARYLLASLVTKQPFVILRDQSPEMRRAVEALADSGNFDVVHADQLGMAQYAENLTAVGKLLDEHNAVWMILERLCAAEQNTVKRALIRRECEQLKMYEGSVCRKFDQVLTVTETDRAALRSLNPDHCNIDVIPICIDTSAIRVVERASGTKRILYVGTMFWPPNIDGVLWFTHEVYPLIKQDVAQARFRIVGARPPKDVRQLAHLPLDIEVTGYVEDLYPYWTDCGVFVVPLRAGGGMRVKILEALARGIPIVSTSIGCEGIAVEDGQHLLVADTPQEFAHAVAEVIRNDDLATRLTMNGRCLVEERYDWRVTYQELTELYDTICPGLHHQAIHH
jgi:glycosyltransferase involved in cell wall biosynthesis